MKRALLTVGILLCASLALGQQQAAASPDEAAQLKKLEKEYFATKAQHTRKPDAETKSAFVKATVRFGTASMTAASLSPKVKYRRALRLYREALKLDPKNKEALNNKAMIESIYKSMGRPIPQ